MRKGAKVYLDKGNAKYALKQYEEAIKDYDKALKISSDYSPAYYNKGLAQVQLKIQRNCTVSPIEVSDQIKELEVVKWDNGNLMNRKLRLNNQDGYGIQEYYDEEGTLFVRGYYRNNELVVEKYYYPYGTRQEQITYKDNKKDGLHILYYPNGDLWMTAHYVKGVKEGIEKFYEEGELKQITPYKNGKRVKDGIIHCNFRF